MSQQSSLRNSAVVIVAVLVSAVIAAGVAYVGTSAYYRGQLDEARARSRQHAEQAQELSRRVREMAMDLHRLRALRIRADGLYVTSLKLSHTEEGGAVVTGQLYNVVDRTVGDVELTAYLLDAERKPVLEKTFVSKAGPMGKDERRDFRVELPEAPPGVLKPVVIITGMGEKSPH